MVRKIKKLLTLPLVITFLLCTQKKIIREDLKRWAKIGKIQNQGDLKNLSTILVGDTKHFRNLMYFRLLKGNRVDRRLMSIVKMVYKPRHRCRISAACTIGPGLYIQHGYETGFNANIGSNCWINQHVTIGWRGHTGKPTIGDNVRIGVGARVLGKITIGDNVKIGANSVVIRDVPSNCTVVGVPAYIVRKDGKKVKIKL